jgi:hypothetical protein
MEADLSVIAISTLYSFTGVIRVVSYAAQFRALWLDQSGAQWADLRSCDLATLRGAGTDSRHIIGGTGRSSSVERAARCWLSVNQVVAERTGAPA